MSERIESLKAQLESLTAEERADLASFLLRSLDEKQDADTQADWDAELARRMADIENGKVVGKPAAQVFAELREKRS
jgi:putative addiction module component (TIGR02574 family)